MCAAAFLCLANIASAHKSLTSPSPAGTRRGDAGCRPGCCGPISSGHASRSPARDAGTAPPTRHPRSSPYAFRRTDRLLWLCVRWCWPRWREALVLIQAATVDRWHRDGVRRSWRRRSRRSGRPRLDSTCRDLIRRRAAENGRWGAPRIHGDLLKLGSTIAERTVSRYLRGRPTTRSHTWRTFFANLSFARIPSVVHALIRRTTDVTICPWSN